MMYIRSSLLHILLLGLTEQILLSHPSFKFQKASFGLLHLVVIYYSIATDQDSWNCTGCLVTIILELYDG